MTKQLLSTFRYLFDSLIEQRLLYCAMFAPSQRGCLRPHQTPPKPGVAKTCGAPGAAPVGPLTLCVPIDANSFLFCLNMGFTNLYCRTHRVSLMHLIQNVAFLGKVTMNQ